MSSEYADVTDMFRELRSLPEESEQYARQRERIVHRCLPLTEHIARRFPWTRRGPRGPSSGRASWIDGADSGDDDAPLIVERLGGADPELVNIENRESLRPLLAKLPERGRTVLMLRFFESMTQTQIAARIGVSQMHVSRMLAKALAQLRDELS